MDCLLHRVNWKKSVQVPASLSLSILCTSLELLINIGEANVRGGAPQCAHFIQIHVRT